MELKNGEEMVIRKRLQRFSMKNNVVQIEEFFIFFDKPSFLRDSQILI